MTLHLKSRGYPFRPRLLFSSFIVVGVGFPTVYYFRRGHIRFSESKASCVVSAEVKTYKKILAPLSCLLGEARIVVMLDEGVTSAPHRGAHHPRGRGW